MGWGQDRERGGRLGYHGGREGEKGVRGSWWGMKRPPELGRVPLTASFSPRETNSQLTETTTWIPSPPWP